MTVTAAPPRVVSLGEFEVWHAGQEERYELVNGVPVMVPPESVGNLTAASALNAILREHLRGTRRILAQTAIHLPSPDGVRHTVRIPDLAVVARDVDPDESCNEPGVFALVVECVSPSSVERDWVTKRREYAAAEIPNYLVVDVRDASSAGPQVWLFDRVKDGEYEDPTGDGSSVTVRIDGKTITITAAELLE